MAPVKAILVIALLGIGQFMFAQQREKADKLVAEGVGYHDKGDYDGALSRYNKALGLDKDNLMALTEKAYTLLTLKKYDECIACCKKAVEVHPKSDGLKTLYVTYGSAYDELKQTDKSIEVYEEGIKLFPDFYLLHFNKGISLASVKRYDEAVECLQRSVALNPKHPGSHNALARIQDVREKRIPAFLAYCRFFVLEPESERAKENLGNLQHLLKGNVQKTGKKAVTISINPSIFGDTTADGKPKSDNFLAVDLILSLGDIGLDLDKKSKSKSETELFIQKMQMVCSTLKESKKDNHGFYWDYYVPYFVDMNEHKLVETFGYLVYASSPDKDVAKWIKTHKADIDKFYEWSNSYAWNSQWNAH